MNIHEKCKEKINDIFSKYEKEQSEFFKTLRQATEDLLSGLPKEGPKEIDEKNPIYKVCCKCKRHKVFSFDENKNGKASDLSCDICGNTENVFLVQRGEYCQACNELVSSSDLDNNSICSSCRIKIEGHQC